MLYNLTGNIINTTRLNTSSTQIDISSYPKGIYLYKIVNEQEAYSGKVVIQ